MSKRKRRSDEHAPNGAYWPGGLDEAEYCRRCREPWPCSATTPSHHEAAPIGAAHDFKEGSAVTNEATAAEVLRKHIGMGYGAGSPIRCECRKLIGSDMSGRYELLAEHQAAMLAAAGLLVTS